jgi:hypothetical protein
MKKHLDRDPLPPLVVTLGMFGSTFFDDIFQNLDS